MKFLCRKAIFPRGWNDDRLRILYMTSLNEYICERVYFWIKFMKLDLSDRRVFSFFMKLNV